ncbi:MAG TPA: NAD-dependent epimerase/dehydratase family protein [Candidatus Binatia bacterium]|nr:NAD-dependent epimerase/dehydratase family protein [Candidatus Binatia bacterium]
MPVAIITGSAGLVGSACARLFAAEGFDVVGIDNDMRAVFFGPEASTAPNRLDLERTVPRYRHHDFDVRDKEAVGRLFAEHAGSITAVVHAAAQPSHDWAARDVETDFEINARATLTLLEATRRHCPEAAFVFMSTNKVYGDTPNRLPLVEHATRWEIAEDHPFFAHGIDESMSVDATTHSLFGASKLAADGFVQEYGRYFGLKTACFRAGCITGPAHAGTHLHGFLSYLVRCAVAGTDYAIVGHKGKQVRDNLHADDLASMCLSYCRAPRAAEVYNVGGGRHANCSVREAIAAVEDIIGTAMKTHDVLAARKGDHVWYVSDTRKFRAHYPEFRQRYDLNAILSDICTAVGKSA